MQKNKSMKMIIELRINENGNLGSLEWFLPPYA